MFQFPTDNYPLPEKRLRMEAESQTVVAGQTVTTYIKRLRTKVNLLQSRVTYSKSALEKARRERDHYKQQLEERKRACQCHILTKQQQ